MNGDETKNHQEISRLIKELSIANQRLQEKDRAREEFLYIAAHQLRTPLAIIKGYASMLANEEFGHLEPPIEKPIKKVKMTADAMSRLIDDLLFVGRSEAGRLSYYGKDASFADLVKDATGSLKLTADEKRTTLLFRKPDDPLVVYVDDDKIRQAATNIIDNAIQYTEGGAIVVVAWKETDRVMLEVSDTGAGMDTIELGRLFEKMYSGKDGTVARGSGLGLYVAKRIVEDHGGKIWAESEGAGKGSIIKFWVPLKAKFANNS
ncbi:MAG: hypothetical protein A2939_01105 [Parcubacteria group bacterium RIFCSPLOWO2_01_FULL_48_18]|nr:MAG: hypothetical protein A2939_01105 [Parcubacteria group bacterium RIFCSPLOWO2_01_FULL_48_18]OHB24202.1 MAG: hypothetical protein A3J67_02075 [Parcubacteria group bacterium RIFCSPHIGHO2_02_FULL_48_10b]